MAYSNRLGHFLSTYLSGKIGCMPTNFTLKTADTLGIRIVKELAHQIRGTLNYSTENGSVFTLVFPLVKSGKQSFSGHSAP